MNNTPTYITTRLADLNRKVGIFAEVEWTADGFQAHTEDLVHLNMEGACYIVYKQTTGMPYAVVRTMSEAFQCAWALFKAYRRLERGF
jgi:hypothetical protein